VSETTASIPLTHELLVEGGDARIHLKDGRNQYGCKPCPDSTLAQFGSSTASTISAQAFEAADALRRKIMNGAACSNEFERIGNEFSSLCGISDLAGLTLHFCSSGTDAHQLASRLMKPAHILIVSASETGRGIPAALSGGKIHQLQIRNPDGAPRNSHEIDEEATKRVASLMKKKSGRVLLVLVDVSKTGMIAPTLSCARHLKTRFPDAIEVLVDASQFRIGSLTLRAYLEAGFLVAVTGSKFLAGPIFSGMLLIPESFGQVHPAAQDNNIGLLLRWEAALAELRAFRKIPETSVKEFLSHFADAVGKRLEADPCFEPLPVPSLNRQHPGWDNVQTIFPFRIKRRNGRFPGMEEIRRIHVLLSEDLSHISQLEIAAFRCTIGQPVACGALRLCSSSRLVVEGVENSDTVLHRALLTLDKTVWLISSNPSLL
jgi:hypothetical protein